MLLLIPLMLLVFWAFVLRPQQKRMKEQQAMLASLEEGDEIVTASGLYGVITEFDGPTVFIEVADGVEVKITRASIGERVSYDELVDDKVAGEKRSDDVAADD